MAYSKPVPKPSPETAAFWEGTRKHQLMIPWCGDCQKFFFFPRSFCPFCYGENISWEKSGGKGSVYTFTVVHRASIPSFSADVPYVYALIDLEEGVRMTGNIMDCDPKDVYVGMPVEAFFVDISPEITLVQFKPVN